MSADRDTVCVDALTYQRERYVAAASRYPGTYPSRGAVARMLTEAFEAGWAAARKAEERKP